MNNLILDYVVGVLEQVEYQLSALAFLRCELYGEDEWEARNHFLSRYSEIANEALLWLSGRPYANKQAREQWMRTLA